MQTNKMDDGRGSREHVLTDICSEMYDEARG